ncbi:MAG: 6-pyruvoyl tetrahydrobiopterin synthase [Ignavibacteria bacterium RIFOXYB2_FULL_35_12]|nr:MAG: 6-pyruvoyl tetrahydrobiopterin synthase [Ignavibacteria bacterium GWA2_36_19]OGU54118.1 MAG: 6-pyruvoyl tetrahydrobiopterin synthase [Ignavibacteria bacterium GWC2_35_8]OGU59540.1 MAG: 6-pyruvoyl tetrahydrobiopterin synthase [Ignavibacteria bacterium GWF2_35_20]OGU78108.1 MAG: 6-pyruvoyl tetrahydrobiopterin synthase [Ignavibacteria bacterium RIFOXYA2_FULL_35_9]OGU87249.1 MAG: 6-pyruvoyl tetrahydrobiopterin synthase [Ignavibacteria bacterium RIFOXYA12_FULL_35_25]OGU90350.1 MAG: 6-pyruvo
MVYITRRETFSAAHRLFNPIFSNEENEKNFGKCSNPNWHGHNYVLEVVIAGEPNPETGFVLNIADLKEIIEYNVLSQVDHKNLNTETDFMSGIIPSTENLTIAIWKVLVDKIPNGKLYAVKLSETENNFFEYRGE